MESNRMPIQQVIEIFIRTIKEKINKVKLIYGAGDWDRRIEFLAGNLTEEQTKKLNEAEVLTIAFNILAFPFSGMNDTRKWLVLNSSRELISFILNAPHRTVTIFNPFRFTYDVEELKEKFKVHYGKVNQALMVATLLFKYKTGSQSEYL